MLGLINGTQVNAAVVNGTGTEVYIFGDLIATQDDATVTSAADLSIDALLTQAQDDHGFLSEADVSIFADLEAAQEDDGLLVNASIDVTSMAEWTHDDHTLSAMSRQMLQRKRLGAGLSAHGPGSSITRHVAGSSLTVH